MKTLRLGVKVIQTLVKDKMHYPDRLLADIVSMIARCGVLLVLYSYVIEISGGFINGFNYQVIAWSIFLYFSNSILNLRGISRQIMSDIQQGSIEVIFTKPIYYLGYRMWWILGSGLYSFLLISAVGVIVLCFLVGIPETMKVSFFLPTIILSIILGSVLTLIVYALVGVLAFWMEDVLPIFWIVDKAVMILGGSYLPVALFPDFMYKMALWSPFGATLFVTHTVYDSWKMEWILKSGIQILWIILLGSLLYYLFGKAKQKVNINGG